MTDEEQRAQPTQQTQPKKGKPVEIPVPKRGAFEKVLRRAEKGSTARRAGVQPRRTPTRATLTHKADGPEGRNFRAVNLNTFRVSDPPWTLALSPARA